MEGQESGRARSKRDVEDNADAKSSRMEDDEDWESVEKRKHRSSKSRKYVDSEEGKEQDSGRRKAYGDKSEERRKSAGSSRAGSGEEDDYDVKRESRSKIPRKSMDERLEKRSSDSYQDRDSESGRKRRDEGNEWESFKRSNPKSSLPENSQSRPRSKVETSNNVEIGKLQEKDSKYPDDKDISKEKKDHGKYEQEKIPEHRRWDESETGRKFEESSYAEKSDSRSGRTSSHNKHGSSRESDFRNESGDGKSRALTTTSEKSRSGNRDGRREDSERSKNRNRLDLQDEDSRVASAPGDTRSDQLRDEKQRRLRERSPGSVEDMEQYAHRNYKPENEKSDKQKQQRNVTHGSHDDDNQEKTVNVDDDAGPQIWDRNTRDERHNKRSRTPERNGRSHREFGDPDHGLSDSDNEMNNKNKERESEGYRDNRPSRVKDGFWNDNAREWEGSKDHWRRSQNRQDSKEGDAFGSSKEWDMQRREQGRSGSESFHGRSGYRKDNRMRSEGARGSSSFRHDSSDSIEIRPNRNLDFGREESASTIPVRKNEGDLQQDYPSGATDEEWNYQPEDRGKSGYAYADDSQERYMDDGSPRDQNSGRDSLDSQSGKGRMQKGSMNPGQQGMNNSGNLQSSFGNFNRNNQPGPKGGRPVRGGRGRLPSREPQRIGLPSPMMGPPFGPIGLPPGPMQPIGPNMTHSTAPPLGPGVFMPPFHGPLVWPGARGVDMNILAVPPNLPPMPPGPGGPRFPPNMGSGPGNSMYFNQPGPVRGIPPSPSAPGFNSMGSIGREMPLDKAPSGWGPQRTNGPSGKAPSRGEQNDYSQNFVDTGMRPQNFIRELELTSVVEDYPKLRELIQRKDEIVSKSSSPPMYYKCDLHEHVLSPDFFGTKFDVILVDPPWEEYVHRAPGITDHLESWTVEEIMNLKIEAIADTPSFIFLWVGDGVGLEQGRQCLKKWGFRRCEDICWVKTNKKNATPSLRHDSHTLFQHSKEHCLMGIKGTVRRSTDGHIIHANIDTDIIIAEEPSDGSTKKPEDMYRIIEHFALGRRRLELFGEDHNIRSGWLTVGKGLSSSNFNADAYVKNFSDKDGKVWQGGGGRNPPPDAPHLVLTTPEIEALRPKSPPQKNQQQSAPIIPVGSSNNRRASGNSPQNAINASLSGMNMDSSISEPAFLAPWNSSPMVGFRGQDGGQPGSDAFDGYGFSPFPTQGSGDHIDFDSHRTVNLL